MQTAERTRSIKEAASEFLANKRIADDPGWLPADVRTGL